jgi:hypothetical protein
MLEVVTPASTLDLVALATVKAELGIIDTTQDSYLSILIREASGLVSLHCQRVFPLETVAETFRRDPSPTCGRFPVVRPVVLTRNPVASITSVTVDGVTLAGTDYEIDKAAGLLWRLTASDTRTAWTYNKLVVTYAAGFTTIPGEVERVTADLVKLAYASRSRDPALRAEKILDLIDSQYQVGGDLTADILARVAQYRQPVVV